MGIWKDSSGGLHDDDNGAALSLASWPKGMTQLTAAQIAALQPAPTLQDVQNAQIALINKACNDALAAIVVPYPPLEVDTWPNQYAEAVAYTANNAAPTPTLSAIATASGQTVAALAASVLQKAAAYTTASGAAVGRRQSLTTQIQAATTVAAVQAIIW